MVERLDTFVGAEDLSAMIRLSVMRKLRTILTNAISFMIPPCSFCPKIFKEKAEVIEPMEVQRVKHTENSNVSFQSMLSISRFVRLFVCPCVRVFTFEVLFKRLLAPTS